MTGDGRRGQVAESVLSTVELAKNFGMTMWNRVKADQPKTLLTYMVMGTGGLFALSAVSVLLCGIMFMAVVASWFAIAAIIVIASCLCFWAVVTAFISFIVASTLGSMTVSLYVAMVLVDFAQGTVLPAAHSGLVYLRGARNLPLGASRLTQPLSALVLYHVFRDADASSSSSTDQQLPHPAADRQQPRQPKFTADLPHAAAAFKPLPQPTPSKSANGPANAGKAPQHGAEERQHTSAFAGAHVDSDEDTFAAPDLPADKLTKDAPSPKSQQQHQHVDESASPPEKDSQLHADADDFVPLSPPPLSPQPPPPQQQQHRSAGAHGSQQQQQQQQQHHKSSSPASQQQPSALANKPRVGRISPQPA